MSKFESDDKTHRIQIQPSRLWRWCQCLSLAFLLVAVFAWQPGAIEHQLVIQSLLASILCLYFGRIILQKQHGLLVSLTAQGRWLFLEREHNQQWRLTSQSRITPYLIWVKLKAEMSQEQCTQLVFKDAVSEADYRLICRTIMRLQRNRKMTVET